MAQALREHWPEYAIEGVLLGLFMVSAGFFGVLLEAPASPVRQALASAELRRVLGGLAMGATAITLIYSPIGKRSGAHMNPALTLAFLRLGKVKRADAYFYATAQLAGGIAGVLLVAALFGDSFREPPVLWVATLPGMAGPLAAFAAEAGISFGLMAMVLVTTSHTRVAPWTGVIAGAFVATYIAVESPLSGMSMNPARTLASALPAGLFADLWIYLTAPALGMLAAAELWRVHGRGAGCAKLRHGAKQRCIFCGYRPSTPRGFAALRARLPARLRTLRPGQHAAREAS